MPSDLDTMPVPLYHSGTRALDVSCLAVAQGGAAVAPPPEGGVAQFAVRKLLRTGADSGVLPVTGPALLTLQRCAGIALAMMAWIVMLAGLAYLAVAAVRNREGELGVGLDATIHGAQLCLMSLGLGAIGVPLWVFAELRLRKERVVHSKEPSASP